MTICDSPMKRWECDVSAYLIGRGYHVDSVREVIDFTAMHGTSECCPALKFCDTDRCRVESLLPETFAGEWGRYDHFVWTTGGDPDVEA